MLSALDGDRMHVRDLCSALGWEKAASLTSCGACRRTDWSAASPTPTTLAARWSARCRPGRPAAIENAAATRAEDVRRNFIDLLTPNELDTLATLHERIRATWPRTTTPATKASLHSVHQS